jgi:micrococcal nuclease
MAMMRRRRRIAPGYRIYRRDPRFSYLIVIIGILFVILSFYFGHSISSSASPRDSAVVQSTIDGDTIHVLLPNDEQITVRLLGIDTPETHHPTKPVGCFGPEAEQFTRKQLTNKSVKLEYDQERHDKYGRTLAYVYVGDQRFNDVLIENGYAKILSIEPNTKYARTLFEEEMKARENNLGLWGYCTNDN